MKLKDLHRIEISNMKRMTKSHFFDDETMKFFNSKVETVALSKDNKKYYFVTSEKFMNERRKYTLRSFDFDGMVTITNVKTAENHDFQQYSTIAKAMTELEKSVGYIRK
tara:strand:- start:40 stop:366 length:327 start_codon:yes stop_codon:yes gene_type:complete